MILVLIVLYVVSLLYFSVIERFRHYTALIALQGWILWLLTLFTLHEISWPELSFVVAETLIFKAIVVPAMLYRIIRQTGINRVHYASIKPFKQLMFSILALLGSWGITYYMRAQNPQGEVNDLFFGVALYALLCGMMLIVSHKRIFTHMIGFLVIENGVFFFSMAMGVEMPYLINIAILLDILMCVLILGLFMGKIGTRLHDLNADHLTTLKD